MSSKTNFRKCPRPEPVQTGLGVSVVIISLSSVELRRLLGLNDQTSRWEITGLLLVSKVTLRNSTEKESYDGDTTEEESRGDILTLKDFKPQDLKVTKKVKVL